MEKIKKNTHKRWRFPRLTCKNSVRGAFQLNTDIPETEYTSKIVGLSDNWHHHKDSVRIGIRKKNGQIKAYGIFYISGQREIVEICDIEVGKINWFNIFIADDTYFIEVNDKTVENIRTSNYNFIRYTLFPYWGGKEKAPTDIEINLNIV